MMTPRKSRRIMEDLKNSKLWSFVSLLSTLHPDRELSMEETSVPVLATIEYL
jgi:hypothetical protein